MPYCPTHGYQQGIRCSQCGALLSETPPTVGDTIRVRSPEAHASANPTFVLPGGHVETRPALVKCPKCGRRNLEPATFDCQGDCGKENLCERHFDEEFEVCIDCARTLRGEAQIEAERQTQLQSDLITWRQRAEQAEAQVTELTRQGEQAQRTYEIETMQQQHEGELQIATLRAEMEAALTRQRVKLELEMQKQRLAVYKLMIQEGMWGMLAQQLAQNPGDIGRVTDVMMQMHGQKVAADVAMLQTMIQGDMIKDRHIKEVVSNLAQNLQQNMRDQPLQLEQATAEAKLPATETETAKEAGLEQARTDLRRAHERVHSLEQELAAQTRPAEQAEASTAVLTQRSQQAETDLAQRSTEASQAQTQVQMIEKDLASWRGRAEKAESQSASTEHGQQDTRETAGLFPASTSAQKKQPDSFFEEELGGTVDPDLLSILVCPEDKGPLVLSSDGKWLVNLRNGYRYPIRKGVPVMLVEEGRKHKDASLVAQNAQPILTVAIEPPTWQQIGIELVCIPAGEFLYGGDKRKIHLPEYWIAKTPVTNVQYKAFVDATGHQAPDHWKNGRIPSGKEMHPVVKVSWDDAAAFCHWAGLRLPMEQEWEKAARGSDARAYPWGYSAPTPKLGNFQESVIYDTTPVGKYPAGASPYGLLDMAGNVWEWCKDWQNSENKHRVLRGGSWLTDADKILATYSYRRTPDSRGNGVGFRCARSS